ncbi:hypothetical protein DHX103_07500 [Planococcus sp. X10-3]|uniref:hypothetical protein n=1 Tax=Planococcus sp. X10-3 TaxID=3061240 RepID=UPI003BB20F16
MMDLVSFDEYLRVNFDKNELLYAENQWMNTDDLWQLYGEPDEDIARVLGEHLYQYRTSYQLTQKKMAEIIDLSIGTIKRLEKRYHSCSDGKKMRVFARTRQIIEKLAEEHL